MTNAPDATTRFFLSAIDEGNYFFGADDDEAQPEAPQLTVYQLARRRQRALILCQNALNKTSLIMAQRLCKDWFPGCECIRKLDE